MWNFHVKGMSCGHCKKAITDAILALDKQALVEVDIPHGTVKVDSKTASQERVSTAIQEAGYEVADLVGLSQEENS